MWTTLYGGSDGYCGSIKASGSVYSCDTDYGAASPDLALGTELLVCFHACTRVVVDDTCGGCSLDLDLLPAADIGLPGSAVADVVVL